MSQENVELVRRIFDRFETLGWAEQAARAGLLAADAEFDFSALYPDGPIVPGFADWRAYVDALPWARSLTLHPERFFDADEDRVLVFVRATAEGEGSSVPVAMPTAHEYTIRDGVLVRVKVYSDRSEALRAVGLEE